MTTSDQIHTGSCLCGAVRFSVKGALRDVVMCHCGMCLKWHGHAGAYTDADDAQITVAPTDSLAWYRSSGFAARAFCSRCGSSLFWKREGSARTSIAAGTLDQPTGLQTVRHIFTETLADYDRITDGLPCLPMGMGG
ncbi:MAG: GFA family protein [Alphaproteobacteria bacterium]|nr:GFA family protein [Alphaproteobacteria bacterium]